MTTTATSRQSAAPILELRAVAKSFGATQALRGVDLTLRPGTVSALLGGNGSGKSTLIKILAGAENADAGEIVVKGRGSAASNWSHQQAAREGLRFVHQDRGLFDDATVAENLALGHTFARGRLGAINWHQQRKAAAAVLERLGIDVPVDAAVGELRPADQMLVAIARGLQSQENPDDAILVLDEPTAALPAHEAQRLCDALRHQAANGKAILFVSHRIDEVMMIADAVSVLRDGELVADCPTTGLTKRDLVVLISGRELEEVRRPAAPAGAAVPRAAVRNLAVGPLHDLTLHVMPGEVLGIAGLLGTGRTSLLRALFGDIPVRAGSVFLDGAEVSIGSVRAAMRFGIGYVPEDRHHDAAFIDHNVRENLTAARMPDLSRTWGLDLSRERRETAAALGRYVIKAPGGEADFSTLSGGNQQKVILARWLARSPRLLLLDDPTQGVDVRARSEIWQLIRGTTSAGSSVIVVSSDFDELVRFTDRTVVLRKGKLVAELDRDHLSVRGLTELAQGSGEEA